MKYWSNECLYKNKASHTQHFDKMTVLRIDRQVVAISQNKELEQLTRYEKSIGNLFQHVKGNPHNPHTEKRKYRRDPTVGATCPIVCHKYLAPPINHGGKLCSPPINHCGQFWFYVHSSNSVQCFFFFFFDIIDVVFYEIILVLG